MAPVPHTQHATQEPFLPRRDSMEDANASLTRKRPRLGSESREARSLSADLVSSTSPILSERQSLTDSETASATSKQQRTVTSGALPAQQPSRVTINVKSRQTSPHRLTDRDLVPPAVTPVQRPNSPEVAAVLANAMDAEAYSSDTVTARRDRVDAQSASPPVVEIRLDDSDSDDVKSFTADNPDHVILAIYRWLGSFPYASRCASALRAASEIANLFSTEPVVEEHYIAEVAEWLEDQPGSCFDWEKLAAEGLELFDEISTIVVRLLQRRLNLGRRSDPQVIAETVRKLLAAYLLLSSRLISVDLQRLQYCPDEDVGHRMFCAKHLRAMTLIFRQYTKWTETPFLAVLVKDYSVNISAFVQSLAEIFISQPANGLIKLCKLITTGFGVLPTGAIVHIVHLIDTFFQLLQVSAHNVTPYARTALELFRKLDHTLQQVGGIPSVELNRDVLVLCHNLLRLIVTADHSLAATLATELLDKSIQVTDAPSFRIILSNAWKFPLLKKYLLKGRMEQRVMAIAAMDAELINIWHEFNNREDLENPAVQYLSRFILDEKLVEYLVGVDSHPQLISRSSNVVGFLVVTSRYTKTETDKIFDTITTSPDPRVINATICMVKGIVNLMNPPELLYICQKLSQTDISHITVDMMQLLSEIIERLIVKPTNLEEVPPQQDPCRLVIQLLQQAPSSTPNAVPNFVHEDAYRQLNRVLRLTSSKQRSEIYSQLTECVENPSAKTTGSIRALEAMIMRDPDNLDFLFDSLKLPEKLTKELCTYVQTQKEKNPHLTHDMALEYRFEMVQYLITTRPESLLPELDEPLWDHLVGKDAINNTLREDIWHRLASIVEKEFRLQGTSVPRTIIDRWVIERASTLEPVFFSSGFFDFIVEWIKDRKDRVPIGPTANGALSDATIEGLLWRIILTAPEQTIEVQAAQLLVACYMDLSTSTVPALGAAHIALAGRCTEQLLAAFAALKPGITEEASEVPEQMDITLSPADAAQEQRLKVRRTLLFMREFMLEVRSRPEFLPHPRQDPKVKLIRRDNIRGDPYQVKFQVFDSGSSETWEMEVGSLETYRELHARIARITGFSNFLIISSGQKVDLLENSQQIIGDTETLHWLLIKSLGDPLKYGASKGATSRCPAFELEVYKHFEGLYACMDSDDELSEAMHDFLCRFPVNDKVVEEVASGKSGLDLFPSGKPFQARYNAWALRSRLETDIMEGNMDDQYIAHAVRLLNAALLDQSLISEDFGHRHDLALAAWLVQTLLLFLRERPVQDVSSTYFSDTHALVQRLIRFQLAAFETKPAGWQTHIRDAYSVLLDASLHSRSVWDAFTSREDIVEVHKGLLLTCDDMSLQSLICGVIEGICGEYASTSILDAQEITKFYWDILQKLLPGAVEFPKQSNPLFNIAEHIFRKVNEYLPNETSLRECLEAWGRLLLNYRYKEFVGREEVDPVVMGLTRLLSSCVQCLKSFKKPINSSALMEAIFRTFLFKPPVQDLDDSDEGFPLPILESSTRKELYDLVLALCEDSNGYRLLMKLNEELCQVPSDSLPTALMDRSFETRSPTGYVGLHNPRNICYMNSLLTQLFMNVEFRRFFLGLDIDAGNESQQLLFETQNLFANLQNRLCRATSSTEFASQVRGLDGEPIDITVQMDADEFYNLIFDQWEGQMGSPDLKQEFRSLYGGETVTQIKSMECEHVSERSESFFVVQCDVKGKPSLEDSLQYFVEGDVMEGDNKYKCESCGGKYVNAVKRTCLKTVPDNLIFHLKRFDFDLSHMTRYKIDDHFAFPRTIDMSLYNVAHLSDPNAPRQEDVFVLVGILVHSGTTDGGHYYSFIRERPSTSPDGSGMWMEFNDRDVTEFDPSLINSMSYGGYVEDPQFGHRSKSYSAYMLFYERASAMEAERCKFLEGAHGPSPKVPVPLPLRDMIARDNEAWIRYYCLLDPSHMRFIRLLLHDARSITNGVCSEDHVLENKAINQAVLHLYTVLSRCKDVPDLETFMSQLKRRISACTRCCEKFLGVLALHDQALYWLTLCCYNVKVRALMCDLIIETLQILRSQDPQAYGMGNGDSDSEDGQQGLIVSDNGLVRAFVQRLQICKDEQRSNSRAWNEFYSMIAKIIELGVEETALLLNAGFFHFALRILCVEKDEELRNINLVAWRAVEKRRGIIFNGLIELVYRFLHRMDLGSRPLKYANSSERYNPATRLFRLSEAEWGYLTDWNHTDKGYTLLLRIFDIYNFIRCPVAIPEEMIKFLLSAAPPRSDIIHRIQMTFTTAINETAPAYVTPHIQAAIALCSSSPSATDIMGIIQAVSRNTSQLNGAAGEVHLEFFHKLASMVNHNLVPPAGVDCQEWFYFQCINVAHEWGPNLLTYEDYMVRQGCETLLLHLLVRCELASTENEVVENGHFQAIRKTARAIMTRINDLRIENVSRTYIEPAKRALDVLMTEIDNPATSGVGGDAEQSDVKKSSTDAALLQRYNALVHNILPEWPVDDDDLIGSGNEALDDSEYDTSDELDDSLATDA